MTMTTLAIALLVCDTPPAHIATAHGDYATLFSALLMRAFARLRPGATLTVDPYDVRSRMEYPEDLSAYDGVLITGSVANAYDDDEWILKLRDYCAAFPRTAPTSCRLAGVCFGHQIIGRAHGATVAPSERGWEVGVVEIALTDAGRRHLDLQQPSIRLSHMHRDHLTSTPDGFTTLASTPHTPLQILISPRAFTVQAHPEVPAAMLRDVIAHKEKMGVLSRDEAEACLATTQGEHDGEWLGGKLVEFFLGRLHPYMN